LLTDHLSTAADVAEKAFWVGFFWTGEAVSRKNATGIEENSQGGPHLERVSKERSVAAKRLQAGL